MKLAEYLQCNSLTETDFADLIQVRPITVSRYIKGERIPHRDEMARIHAATNGAVQPNDFYPLAESEREFAA